MGVVPNENGGFDLYDSDGQYKGNYPNEGVAQQLYNYMYGGPVLYAPGGQHYEAGTLAPATPSPGATSNQSSPGDSAVAGTGYYDKMLLAANQDYLRNRLAQLEIPTLDLQRQGQLFTQGMQQAQMSGYQAPLTREAAIDYIWAQRPDLQNLAKAQGIDYSSPERRRQFIEGWLRAVTQMGARDEPVVTRWGGDPLEVAKAMGAGATPTFEREQATFSQDVARQQQRLALAQLLGYMPEGNTARAISTAATPPGPTADIQPYGGFDVEGLPRTTATPPISGETLEARRAREALEEQRAGRLAQEAFQTGGLTGTYGGQETLAARAARLADELARSRLGLEQTQAMAGLTGTYGGQETVAARAARLADELARSRLGLEQTQATAGLTGTYGGQETLAARQARKALEEQQASRLGEESWRRAQLAEQTAGRTGQEAFQQAGLTGVYGGAPTLAALQAERQYGLGTRAQTLAEREAEDRRALALAGLTGTVGGQETLEARNARLANELAQSRFGLEQRGQTEVERARQAGETMQAAGLTGLYGGAPTLAAQRQTAELGLAERGQNEQERAARASENLALQRFGSEDAARVFSQNLANRQFASTEDARAFGQQLATNQFGASEASRLFGEQMAQRQFNAQEADRSFQRQFAERQLISQERLQEAGLTGVLGGQQTIAARSLAEQVRAQQAEEALRAANLTGRYGEAPTLEAQRLAQDTAERERQFGLSQGALTGQYQGQATLEKQRLAEQDRQFYSQLRANLSGPRDWLKYQQVQPKAAFGEVKAGSSWEGMDEKGFWRTMQGIPTKAQDVQGNAIPATVLQPHQISQTAYARMAPTQRAMQEGTWSAQGIDPQDAWKRMQASWNTGAGAKTRQWR